MFNRVVRLALPAALLLAAAAPAPAQGPPPLYPDRGGWYRSGLEGTYVNVSNGGRCRVCRRPGGLELINENGTPALFNFVAPGRMEMVAGDWAPGVSVSVVQGRDGRPALRFDSQASRPGIWEKID